jgi:hypothetical protein
MGTLQTGSLIVQWSPGLGKPTNLLDLHKGAATMAGAMSTFARTCFVCHCEERSDEAISDRGMGDCFASLAMT